LTAECRQKWSQFDENIEVCLKDTTGIANQDGCYGDSGGPAYKSDLTVFGLTSFGDTKCNTAYPAVWTRVSAFRPWIQGTTGL